MSRPKKCLVKCYLEEESMQRLMNGIFAGEEDPGVVNQWFPIIDKINNNQ